MLTENLALICQVVKNSFEVLLHRSPQGSHPFGKVKLDLEIAEPQRVEEIEEGVSFGCDVLARVFLREEHRYHMNEDAGGVVQVHFADLLEVLHLLSILHVLMAQAHALPQLLEGDREEEDVKERVDILQLPLLLTIQVEVVAHDRILVGEEDVLCGLLPVDRADQVGVEDERVLILLHGLEPEVKLILDLEDLDCLAKDVKELWDIDVKLHCFALFGNFRDQVEKERDQIVRDYLHVASCVGTDILEAVVDDFYKGVRILNINLNLYLFNSL